MPRDKRPYITVHDGMPWHPKVEGLSDKAFRLLVESWCWCSLQKTDGRIKATSWAKRGSAAARRELIAAGLAVDDGEGGVIMHDYDQHQKTSEEIAEYQEQRAEEGAFGGHQRWHVNRGKRDSDCKFCIASPMGHPMASR
jgi:hypothetical protein